MGYEFFLFRLNTSFYGGGYLSTRQLSCMGSPSTSVSLLSRNNKDERGRNPCNEQRSYPQSHISCSGPFFANITKFYLDYILY